MKLINDIKSIDGSVTITYNDNSTETINGNDISNLLHNQQQKIDELTNFAEKSLTYIKYLKECM